MKWCHAGFLGEFPPKRFCDAIEIEYPPEGKPGSGKVQLSEKRLNPMLVLGLPPEPSAELVLHLPPVPGIQKSRITE
jgi:hypothetical protein